MDTKKIITNAVSYMIVGFVVTQSLKVAAVAIEIATNTITSPSDNN